MDDSGSGSVCVSLLSGFNTFADFVRTAAVNFVLRASHLIFIRRRAKRDRTVLLWVVTKKEEVSASAD